MIIILDKLLIIIGDIILRLVSFPSLFLSGDFKNNFKFDFSDDESKIDYLSKILKNRKFIFLLILLLIISFLLIPMEIAMILLIIILMLFVTVLYLPKFKQKKKYDDITIELPYALRHMATELKSGKGLHDVLITVSNADYGSLSLEFKRVIEEVKYGENTEIALISMSKRVKSEGLTRAVRQIISTLRVGGNLSKNLTIIADDISFDMQIKLKDYTQKLNGFILIYTFLAILLPVVLLIMLMASSTVMGDIVPSSIIFILYIFLFPMVVLIMGVLIKSLEPKI